MVIVRERKGKRERVTWAVARSSWRATRCFSTSFQSPKRPILFKNRLPALECADETEVRRIRWQNCHTSTNTQESRHPTEMRRSTIPPLETSTDSALLPQFLLLAYSRRPQKQTSGFTHGRNGFPWPGDQSRRGFAENPELRAPAHMARKGGGWGASCPNTVGREAPIHARPTDPG